MKKKAIVLNNESIVMYTVSEEEDTFPFELTMTFLNAQTEGMPAQSVSIWGHDAVIELRNLLIEMKLEENQDGT